MTYYAQVAAFKRALILHTLAATGGNHLRAARLLGMQNTYLYRLQKKLGIGVGRAPEGR